MAKKKGKQLLIFDLNHEYEGSIARNAQEVEKLIYDEHDRIVFRGDDESEDIFSDINDVFRVAWDAGDLIVLVDEADFFIGSRDYNVQRSNFLRCVQFGRHRGIDMILCARRVVELNIFVRAQYTKMYTFKQTEERDLKRLSDYGFDASEVRGLASHKFLSTRA